MICFTLVVGSTFLALRLPPSSDVPKLFPDDHNVQRFIDWTQSRFADESLSCASYTECAEKSLQELEELERLSPPAAGGARSIFVHYPFNIHALSELALYAAAAW